MPQNGFVKDTYTVPKKIGAILSHYVPINGKLFMHFSYLYSIPFKIKEESIIIAKNNIHYEQANKTIHQSWS